MRGLISSLAFVLVLLAPAGAQEALPSVDNERMKKTLSQFAELVGGSVESSTVKGVKVVSLTADRETINKEYKTFQELRILNPDISQTYINTHQNSAPITIAIKFAVAAVLTEFRTEPSTDKTLVVGSLLVADDFGRQQKIPIFSFGFDRALFKKINWEKFDDAKIVNVARSFKFEPWARAHLLD